VKPGGLEDQPMFVTQDSNLVRHDVECRKVKKRVKI
jgi:hypothetical protein